MRPLAAGLAALCLALGAPAAPLPQEKDKEKPKERTNAEKLVGKWKLTGGPMLPPGASAHVEYTKDGKMVITIDGGNGQKAEMKGTYKLDKDKIDYKVALPNGQDKTEILTINKLTDDELVTTDPDGVKEEFKRVKEEKKDKEKKDG